MYQWKILEIWKGGMSFHGGICGVIIAAWLFGKKYKFKFLAITDLVALYAPIGIFLGRIANFINDELWGRVTDVPWAVKFPSGGYLPRHPSQLYEAFFEGIILFIILNCLWKLKKVRCKCGTVSAIFVLTVLFSTYKGWNGFFSDSKGERICCYKSMGLSVCRKWEETGHCFVDQWFSCCNW